MFVAASDSCLIQWYMRVKWLDLNSKVCLFCFFLSSLTFILSLRNWALDCSRFSVESYHPVSPGSPYGKNQTITLVPCSVLKSCPFSRLRERSNDADNIWKYSQLSLRRTPFGPALKLREWSSRSVLTNEKCPKGPVIIYRLGVGRGRGGFGAKQGEIQPIHPVNVTSLKWSPLITFDDFHDPLHVFIFQANLSGPLSESFQSFQCSSFMGSQLRLILAFCSPKNQVIPPKILRPFSPPPPHPLARR